MSPRRRKGHFSLCSTVTADISRKEISQMTNLAITSVSKLVNKSTATLQMTTYDDKNI